ncbi:MAG: dienelactone hydrolase family protein [Dehalococcoidia bacterium]
MAEDVISSAVSYKVGDQDVSAFLCRPRTPGTHPALVVIQEWWGVDNHIKDVTRRFCNQGYVALAVDLYSHFGNKITADPNEAEKLMANLRHDVAMKYLNEGVNYLKAQEFVKGDRIGVVGFCMGGGYALLMACQNREIKASAPFYGQIVNEEPTEEFPVNPIDLIPRLSCHLLYFHAGQDPWITTEHANRLRDALVKHNKPGQVQSYADADHAFFNDTREVYHEKAAKDAWQKTLAFFQTHLKS